MRKISKSSFIVLMVAAIVATVLSCNKKFDNPPAYVAPNITANTTIRALKAMHRAGGYEQITTDIVISGIVVADDKSGNLYKQVCLQDSTGGITLSLNSSGLYGQYPVGRQLFVKCNGLWLSDYGKLIQLGAIDKSVPNNPAATGIPSALFDNYIIKGSLGNTVTPRTVTISQLNIAAAAANANPSSDTLQSTLIKIANAQFQTVGLTYSDTSANKSAVSRTIMDCGSNTTVLYTSGYANFAGATIPSGNGPVVAVYVPYRTTSELLLRDTTDIQFTGARCTGVATSFLSETFPSIVNKANIVSGQTSNVWQNVTEAGTTSFVGYVSGSTKMASISSFASAPAGATQTSWFISPAINLASNLTTVTLSFTCIDGYDNGATLKVLVSTNYNGTSTTPSTATWTTVPAAIPTGQTTGYSPAVQVTADLSSFKGQKIYLAFRYDGLAGGSVSSNNKTTTYEFGPISISGF
ncbi:MAG: choice-of-anchor J domain-containing protein [Sphingobacteriia bacterium]|nr:choice-of-anchor J domain-containing protein [Sphingobacteriia bacterium]